MYRVNQSNIAVLYYHSQATGKLEQEMRDKTYRGKHQCTIFTNLQCCMTARNTFVCHLGNRSRQQSNKIQIHCFSRFQFKYKYTAMFDSNMLQIYCHFLN